MKMIKRLKKMLGINGKPKRLYSSEEIRESCNYLKMVSGIMADYSGYNQAVPASVNPAAQDKLYGGGAVYPEYRRLKDDRSAEKYYTIIAL